MKTTLITHFWNEEILLPYWLKHHVELFDHGVLINYRSTDNSVAIIKELAPHWELHDTINPDFEPKACDREVEHYEQQHEGWKLALNTTEFLFCDNLKSFLSNFTEQFPKLPGVRTNGVIMVDSEEEQCQELDLNKPLVLQRHHGYVEATYENALIGGWTVSRSRLLHRMPQGNYPAGRHEMFDYGALYKINEIFGTDSRKKGAPGVHPNLFLCWFGKFSPFEATKRRYLALNALRTHRVSGLAWTQESELPKYEQELVGQRERSIDLLTIPKYKEIYDAIVTG